MRSPTVSICALLATAGAIGFAAAQDRAAGRLDPSYARPAALASKALMLQGVRSGKRLVAVGEYGVIIVSDDNGRSWRQAKSVPTRTTLTGLHFVDEQHGWAVGHGGIILASRDGGETWTLQAGKPDATDILFSVWFKDASRGFAVGSYGYAVTTDDGGRTWKALKLGEGEDAERHLNQIFPGPGRTLFVAAETGRVFRSNDEGMNWQALSLPYKGSLWGGTMLADGSILVWGMRGHALLTKDAGATWMELQTGTDQSITSAIQLSDGRLVLAGLGGVMLFDRGGMRFENVTREDRQTVTSLISAEPGRLSLFTHTGVADYALEH